MKVCHSKPQKQAYNRQGHKSVKCLTKDSDGLSENSKEYSLYKVTLKEKLKPLSISVCIDGVAVSMELDTGASVSLVSEKNIQASVAIKGVTEILCCTTTTNSRKHKC